MECCAVRVGTRSGWPDPPRRQGFSIDFDFIDHQLIIAATGGERRAPPLQPGPNADFYRDVMAALDELGLFTEIWTMPVEIPEAIPFDNISRMTRSSTAF